MHAFQKRLVVHRSVDLFTYLLTYLLGYSAFKRKVLNCLGMKYRRKKNRIWNSYGADSETGNVSARQDALNRWTTTDRVWRWNKNAVSRGSVVASVKRLPICTRNSWALTLMRPNVSRATGKKLWVPLIN